MKPHFPPPLPAPEADPVAKERALHRALIALSHPTATAPDPLPFTGTARLRVAAFALLGLVAGVVLLFAPASAPNSSTTMAQKLHELEILFPGQLNAIIERKGDLQLDLASPPDASTHQPVYIELSRHGETVRVISFSGRRVTVLLGRKEITFEPLVTGNGEVMVVGEGFLWTPGERDLSLRYEIKAHPLTSS